jgi:hypothetical protein
VVWLSVTLLTLLVVDSTSIRNWVLVTAVSIVPGLVLLKLWSDRPSTKVAASRATTR